MARAELVGILNITPDSFSDGGLFVSPEVAVAQARKLFEEGSAIVDIGAESTNPWSSPLSSEQEWQRLEPVLPVLLHEYAGRLSLDTYHPETAKKVLELGPIIINDITTFRNPRLRDVAAEHQAVCIVSHLPLEAPDIQTAHKEFRIDSINQVVDELLAQQDKLISAGVPGDKIVLDPGIGFGKTMELNRKLLRFAEKVPGRDVLIGYSRKRFLGENRMELEPNLEAGRIAIASGTRYLRVHDVAGHRQLVDTH